MRHTFFFFWLTSGFRLIFGVNLCGHAWDLFWSCLGTIWNCLLFLNDSNKIRLCVCFLSGFCYVWTQLTHHWNFLLVKQLGSTACCVREFAHSHIFFLHAESFWTWCRRFGNTLGFVLVISFFETSVDILGIRRNCWELFVGTRLGFFWFLVMKTY